jgi:hypothetical protein
MQDYKPTPYLIKHVDLVFQLNEDVTHVRSRLSMVPNYDSGASPPSLVLDGAWALPHAPLMHCFDCEHEHHASNFARLLCGCAGRTDVSLAGVMSNWLATSCLLCGCAGRKDVSLVGVKVGSKALSSSDYEVSEKKLTLTAPPAGEFELEINVDIKPQART